MKKGVFAKMLSTQTYVQLTKRAVVPLPGFLGRFGQGLLGIARGSGHGELPFHVAGRQIAMAMLLTFSMPAAASPPVSDLEAIRIGAEQFTRRQLAGSPGHATIQVAPLDPRLSLAPCHNVEYFIPPGSRLWGNSSVGARCNTPNLWSIYLQVSVSILTDIVFSTRPLNPGHPLTEQDIQVRTDDITQFAAGVITDPAQALGKVPHNSIAAGYPLRTDMLRAPFSVLQGQSVRLIATGRGFQVNSEGKALNNAPPGGSVSVRTSSGRVVKGTARENGVVEISF